MTKMTNFVLILLWSVVGTAFARPGLQKLDRKLIIGDETARFFEDQFNKTIECIKKQLSESNSGANDDSWDPLVVERSVPIDLNHEYLKINGELQRLVVDGLTDFTTVSLNLSHTMLLQTHFHFDRIHARSFYIGNLNILGLYAFYGDGDLEMEFFDVDIKTTSQYQISPPLYESYSAEISLGKMNFRITGLLGDEELSKLFSIFASSAIPTMINLFKKQITEMISPPMFEHLNEYLGHLPFLDLLALITNYSC